MAFLARSIVPIFGTPEKLPRPTSPIKLSERYNRLRNLIPLNEFESSRLILLYDIFSTRNTEFLAKAPLKKKKNAMNMKFYCGATVESDKRSYLFESN